jgi:hypothetical protein
MNNIRVLYKDDVRKQFVAYGTCSEEIVANFQDRICDNYKPREKTWSETISDWINPNPIKIRRTYYAYKNNGDYTGKDIISLSINLLTQAGIQLKKAHGHTGYVHLQYIEMTNLTQHGAQYYYEFNENVYSCIYCFQKDPSIVDGHFSFYPHFKEECNVTNITKWFSDHNELSLPLEPGSVILLSGKTVYNIPKVSGNGAIKLIQVIFCNDNTEPPQKQ